MDTIQSWLQVNDDTDVTPLSADSYKQISLVLIQEWQSNPWLLERDVPPWFLFRVIKGRVCITVQNNESPETWNVSRLHCSDFWFALERLFYADPMLKHKGIYIDDSRDIGHVQFPGIQPYAQRLSQALINYQDFLLLDLRRIISQYIFFI